VDVLLRGDGSFAGNAGYRQASQAIAMSQPSIRIADAKYDAPRPGQRQG